MTPGIDAITATIWLEKMAETYARMDKASADGMKTADAAVAAVIDGWARVRDDSMTSVEWVVYVLDGKTYKLAAEGSGRPELLNALDEAAVNFCGLLDGPVNARKFYHLLYVGAEVGIIKKNKAQLQKAAVFNAMPGAAGEVQLDAKTPERLAELLV